MRVLNFIFLFIFFTSASYSEEVQLKFEQANQFYREGEYEKAASLYEEVVKNGFESPELYYNLANSHFKLDNIAAAILYYERAKKYSPNDDDIIYNLTLANLKVVDKIEPIPKLFFIQWWDSIKSSFSSKSWAILTVIFLWTALFFTAIFRISRFSFLRRISFFGGIILIAVTIFSLMFAIQQNKYENSENMAVIFAQTVSIKSSPDERGTDLFILHEGVKVEILEGLGKWVKIRLADGKVGWLTSDVIEII